MLKTRLIPVLLLKNGLIVRSERFMYHQIIGDPITQLERYNSWGVDELIYLDISRDDVYDVRREDAKIKTSGRTSLLDIITVVSQSCFMPLTFGGRIRTLEDIRQRLERGADKVAINTMAVTDAGFVREAARTFGNQCIVVSIDALRHPDGRWEVMTVGGAQGSGIDPVACARAAEAAGAGEILLNSVDRDGTAAGYDLELIRRVAEAVRIPVIACGGVGRFGHFVEGVTTGQATAVAAANIFHFTELSYKRAKQHLAKAGINVRI